MRTPGKFQYAVGRKSPLNNPLMDVEGAKHGGSSTSMLTVLVVDDQPDLADMVALLLGAHGFEVRVAYSALAALEILEADSAIDALFTDIVMPGMNGLELAGIVEDKYPGVKIVVTSGYASPALTDSYQTPKLFLTKPYSIDKLIRMLLT